ncbi:hypothetical protein CLOP_g1760, partial [Closterium sp. NIES-67]
RYSSHNSLRSTNLARRVREGDGSQPLHTPRAEVQVGGTPPQGPQP